MLSKDGVRRLQIAVLHQAVKDYLNPDCDYRRIEVINFFRNPANEIYNPFDRLSLIEMLEVLTHARLDN